MNMVKKTPWLESHDQDRPFEFNNFFSDAVTLLLNWNTDAKSRSVDGGFVALVVGSGMGVDCGGGGVKDDIYCGMTVEYIGEDSVITEVGCVLSWIAICLGLRFAQLKTFYCVLLRTDSAKLKTALRFVFKRYCVLSSRRYCVLSSRRSCIFPWKHCACLSQESYVLSLKHCVLPNFQELAFCLRITAPNGEALRKCILSGPYKPTTLLVQAVEATDDSPAILENTTVKTPMNMSPENKAHFLAEKEAIHLILTGIGDEIYSTVDACQIAQEMWEAIERFVTIFKQQHKLDEVSYHKLFDILKQYQREVNELRAERLAREANSLALVAIAQANQDPYYQTSKSHKSYEPSSKPLIPTRSHTTTIHKGKEIAKPITPLSETASEEDNDPEQAQRDKDMQKNLALIAKYFQKIYKTTNNNLRTSLNSRNKNVDTTLRENVGSPVVQQSGRQRFNCRKFRHFAKECRKLKRVKDFAYHKEKMLMCKQVEQGVLLQAEQYDWLANMDEKVDEQELEAHYNYMAKIQEIQKQLKKENTTLAQELKECKVILVETSKSLGESISVRDSCQVALQTKQAGFEKYKAFNDRTVDYDKLERKLNKALGQLAQKDIEIKEGLKTKAYEILVIKEKHDELIKQSLLTKSHYEGLVKQKIKNDSFRFVHELKQEMHADLKYVESLEKEIDELESDKAEFSNMYDVILQECVSKDVMCSYLMSLSDLDALDELKFCIFIE
nr:hypothetical protein [Tanacetum cinerariifolium]